LSLREDEQRAAEATSGGAEVEVLRGA